MERKIQPSINILISSNQLFHIYPLEFTSVNVALLMRILYETINE